MAFTTGSKKHDDNADFAENFTPGNNLIPRGQNSPLCKSLPLAAKLSMGLGPPKILTREQNFEQISFNF
jgi:hypothetical protein